MKEIITAIGFAIGLMLAAGTANATGTPSCQKTGNGHNCTVPGDSTVYHVNTDSEATAIASVVAMLGQNQSQGQGQAQGQNQTATGGNATGGSAVASNGNQSISISNPAATATLGVGLSANVVIGAGVRDREAREWAIFFGKGSTEAREAWCASPTGRKTASCKGGASSVVTGPGFDECSFSKETGKLTVSPRTQYAAEACAITIGMDPGRVKL